MLLAPGVQRRLQPADLLLTQLARLARMGIEPRHHQVGGRGEALTEGQQPIQLAPHQFPIELVRHGGEGDVGGGQQGVQAPVACGSQGREQHRRLHHAGQFGQPLGLAGVGVAGGMPAGLGNRGGDQGLAAAAPHLFPGGGEPGEARLPAGRAADAYLAGGGQGQVEHLQLGGVPQGRAGVVAQLLVALFQPTATAHQEGAFMAPLGAGEGLERHFSADAGRIPQGDGQARRVGVGWGLAAGGGTHAALVVAGGSGAGLGYGNQ